MTGDDLRQAILEYNNRDWKVSELVKYIGARELKMELAGTTDIKSRAYKSAERNVQAWLNNEKGLKKGTRSNRKVSPASQKRLNEIGNSKFKRQMPNHFVLDGEILVGTSPDQARDRTIDLVDDGQQMDESEWEDLVDLALEDADSDTLWAAVGGIYGVDDIWLNSGDISIR